MSNTRKKYKNAQLKNDADVVKALVVALNTASNPDTQLFFEFLFKQLDDESIENLRAMLYVEQKERDIKNGYNP